MGKKKQKIKSYQSALEKIAPGARKTIELKGKIIRERADLEDNNKYSKSKRNLWFKKGYDLLQHDIVIRPYIYKKFRIEHPLILSALVYLFPIQFFTLKDYQFLPLKQHNLNLSNLVEEGYLKIAVIHRSKINYVYTLTDRSVKIVREYYQYLSGEKTLNAKSKTNPFKGPDVAKVDKIRERVMLKFKHQTEMNPSHFRKGLYK